MDTGGLVKPQAGDLVVLYSDGVSEAVNPISEELGRDGLPAIARDLDPSSPEAFRVELTAALHGFRGSVEPLDDVGRQRDVAGQYSANRRTSGA